MNQSALIRQSVGSQLRALMAIARKEWIIFRRYPSWVVSFLIWPVLFPFGYIFSARALAGPDGAALATFARLTGTTDYIAYIVIGTTIYMWFNITLWDVGLSLRNEQMRGTLESNWLCPIWRISIMVGSSLTKALVGVTFVLITVLEFWLLFGVQLMRGNVALLLLVLPLLIACIYGLGIAFGSLVLRFKEANALVFLVRGLVAIFCGITFPLAVLPGWMQTLAAWIPFTYAMHAIRAVALSNATLGEIWPDLQRLLLFAVALPLIGYGAFRFTERRARRTGSLGHY
jgi:ABC-2 type transport system permease protein